MIIKSDLNISRLCWRDLPELIRPPIVVIEICNESAIGEIATFRRKNRFFGVGSAVEDARDRPVSVGFCGAAGLGRFRVSAWPVLTRFSAMSPDADRLRLRRCRDLITLMRPSHLVRHFWPLPNQRFFLLTLAGFALARAVGDAK
jgi:hypothetical protein